MGCWVICYDYRIFQSIMILLSGIIQQYGQWPGHLRPLHAPGHGPANDRSLKIQIAGQRYHSEFAQSFLC